MDLLLKAEKELHNLLNGVVDEGHNLDHAKTVLKHAKMAIKDSCIDLSANEILAIELAALLHDADDSKFFTTINYSNARNIMAKIGITDATIIDLVIEMISLVSCSKNLNNPPPDGKMWKLIPRYADRLEAMGYIGIYRAYLYSVETGRPLWTDTTPREIINDPNRFTEYFKNKKSDSFIDHFYDKILHLVKMIEGCPSRYIIKNAESRNLTQLEFLEKFNKTGIVNSQEIIANKDCDIDIY